MRKNRKSGRPAFKATPALRRKVSIAAGGGMAHEEIALALGICRNTLEKHFEKELSVGAHTRRLEVIDAMHRAAVKGNVAAQKAFMSMDVQIAAPPQPAEKSEPALGKKEQANADAVTAADGTEWGDLLPSGVTPIRRQA